MPRIFLSHSSANNSEALALNSWLASEGWDDVFLDLDPERGITAGERWEQALTREANRCEAVLFLVSKAWLSSQWCQREFHLASKLSKQVFPLLIDDISLAKLPGYLTRDVQIVNLAAGDDHRPFRAKHPVSGAEAHVTFSQNGLKRLRAGLQKAGLDPRFFAWPPADDPQRQPWRGLRPLEAADAGIFYGREGPIIAALDRLRGLSDGAAPRLFVILGASGAGKSSFLRAGLWPRLMRDDQRYAAVPVIRPSQGVISGESGLIAALDTALRAAGSRTNRADIRQAVASGATAVTGLLRQISAGRAEGGDTPGRCILLAIDQAEELFHPAGQDEAGTFMALLASLIRADQPRVMAVFTIRSDAYEPLQTAKDLADLQQTLFNLPPMPAGAWGSVIEGPARRLTKAGRKLIIEAQLTARLLADLEAGGGKDTLPLLSFTLERLYADYGSDGDLKLSEYEAFGGIAGAIDAAVKGAMTRAADDPRVPRDAAARNLLLRRALIPWLAGIDPQTGSPHRMTARFSDMPEESRPLVEHLIEARLLSADIDAATGERVVEPAHEALLRQWGLLKGWLAEDFAALTTLEAVRRATRDWLANGRTADYLNHRAGRLEDAEALHQRPDLAARLGQDDRAYLASCRAAENRQRDSERRATRRLQRAFGAASLLAVMAAGAAWYGFDRAREAIRQAGIATFNEEVARDQIKIADEERKKAHIETERARDNETLSLAALSRAALFADNQPVDALKLALAAWPRSGEDGRKPTLEAVQALADALPAFTPHVSHKGHLDAVLQISLSPDGLLAVTGSADGTARLWDARSGGLRHVLKADGRAGTEQSHYARTVLASFTGNPTQVLTVAWDGSARLWDTATGREIIQYLGGVQFTGARMLPGGRRVAIETADEHVVIWDFGNDTRPTVKVLPAAGAIFGYSDDGGRLATSVFAPSGERIIKIYDTASGVESAAYRAPVQQWSAADVVLTGSSVLLAVVSGDQNALIHDLGQNRTVAEIKGHSSNVNSIAFAPGGAAVLTASADGTARLWDAATGAERLALGGHAGAVESAVFSTDGQQLLTRGADRVVRVWDAASGAQTGSLSGFASQPSVSRFSDRGDTVLTGTADGTATLWSLTPVQEERVLSGLGRVTVAAVSPAANRLLTHTDGDFTGLGLKLWDAKTGSFLAALQGHEPRLAIYDPHFSPDGSKVITSSYDGTARIWDASSGRPLQVLKGHGGAVAGARFTTDGARAVTASDDTTARVWDVSTGAELLQLKGHGLPVRAAGFSPDGTKTVTASSDGTARIWDTATGQTLHVLRGHTAEVIDAGFMPDGLSVFSQSFDGTLRLWDARTGREQLVLSELNKLGALMAVAPDGASLVTSMPDSSAALWRVADGRKIASLKQPARGLSALAYSPDGTRIATATGGFEGGAVMLWDAHSGARLAVLLQQTGNILSLQFWPDGSKLVTASDDGHVRMFDVTIFGRGDGFAMACQRLGSDTSLEKVQARYGLSGLTPICGSHAPAPVDLSRLR